MGDDRPLSKSIEANRVPIAILITVGVRHRKHEVITLHSRRKAARAAAAGAAAFEIFFQPCELFQPEVAEPARPQGQLSERSIRKRLVHHRA